MVDLPIQDKILQDAKAGTGPFAKCKPELRQYAHPGFGTNPSLLVVTEAPSSRQFTNRDDYSQPDTYADYWEYWKRNKDALFSFGLYRHFLRYVFAEFDCEGLDVFDHCLETSVVKWPSHKSSNKKQFKRDATACYEYLLEEFNTYQPEAVIASGNPAQRWTKQAVDDSGVEIPVFEINQWNWWWKYKREEGMTEQDWKTAHIVPVVDDLKSHGFGREWGPQT